MNMIIIDSCGKAEKVNWIYNRNGCLKPLWSWKCLAKSQCFRCAFNDQWIQWMRLNLSKGTSNKQRLDTSAVLGKSLH